MMSTHVPQLDVPSDPQELAQAVGAVMYAGDAASQGLEMKVEEMAPGYARLTMRVRPDMLNGHKTCHGGFIFALADSAFAFFLQFAQRQHGGVGLHHRFPGARFRGATC